LTINDVDAETKKVNFCFHDVEGGDWKIDLDCVSSVLILHPHNIIVFSIGCSNSYDQIARGFGKDF